MKWKGGTTTLTVNYSKGQFKIQEMAFVVVMVMIFFGLASIVLIGVVGKNLDNQVSMQRAQEAKEMVRKIATGPELSFTGFSCESCIDMDKAIALKYNEKYKDYWDLDLLKIVVSYPEKKDECTKTNFPDCGFITLVDKGNNNYMAESSFVSLCHYEFENGGYYKCEFGRVLAGGRALNSS